MKEKLFKEFLKTGKVSDYMKYREEVAKEFVAKNESKKKGNCNQRNRLQGKP